MLLVSLIFLNLIKLFDLLDDMDSERSFSFANFTLSIGANSPWLNLHLKYLEQKKNYYSKRKSHIVLFLNSRFFLL